MKIKPTDVKSSTYFYFKVESSNKDPKFEVDDFVRISKYKSLFAKGYTLYWREKNFLYEKVKNAAPWTYLIKDVRGEEIVGKFCEKLLKKTNKT